MPNIDDFTLGAIQDKPDDRDYLVAAPKALNVNSVVRHEITPIRNQGSRGSCAPHAALKVLESHAMKSDWWKRKWAYGIFRPFDFSEEFLYQLCKNGIDGGCYARSVMESMRTSGAPMDSLLRYGGKDMNEKWMDINEYGNYAFNLLKFKRANRRAVGHARMFRIKEYRRIKTIEQLIHELSKGPVYVSLTMFKHWGHLTDTLDGTAVMDKPEGKRHTVHGLHAMCAYGFNMDKQYVNFANSWGTSWGDKGTAVMPFSVLEQVLKDAYAITI
ncbi:MAG: C1 family peptidase [Polaribacter sp.]|nr:C1 family peptidase [Polaribacter sp.]